MEGTENTTVVVEVKVKTPGANGELIEVFSTESTLTKSEAGADNSNEHFYVHVKPGADGNYSQSSVSVSFHGKLTKADAG